MHGSGKSDRPVVPGKPSNKGAGAPVPAERVEERGLAKGNARQPPRSRTQRRGILPRALERIRQAARRNENERFTALWHHVCAPHRLRASYYALKRQSAPGVDGVTWKEYGVRLADNLADLSSRLRRGAYRPQPVERVYIPKGDRGQRPIGKPVLEDKIVQRWRQKYARGDVIIVRYVDDFVVGFQYRQDAERFLEELRARLQRFGLELHREKTRLIEFGRFAASNRKRRGKGKPETFNFLGFTHICGKTRRGKFAVLRITRRERLTAKLKSIKIELKRRRHDKVAAQKQWISSVLRGHFQYYGVPRNTRALHVFYRQVLWHWFRALRRRSQKHKLRWQSFCERASRSLPQPRVTHLYPNQRLCVTT